MIRRWAQKHGLILAIAFLFLVHLSYLSNGFVWLDHGDIERNRSVVPLSRLHQTFLHRFGETGFYRPVVTIVTSIDAAVYGRWAPGYHLTNVLLHLGVSAMAGYFLSRFFPLTAFERLVVTLIVGVAPVSFLPVGVISYRQESLYALFTLVTVVFFVRRKYLCASIAFLAALFSKETAAFTVPAFLLLWEITRNNYAKQDRGAGETGKRFIGPVITVILYLLLRSTAVPEGWRIQAVQLSWPEAIGTRLWALGKLGIQLITPASVGFSDATPIVSIIHPAALVVMLLLGAAILIVYSYGARSTAGTWLLLLGAAIFPASHVVPLPRFYSPHYGYLGMIIVAMLSVFLLRSVPGKRFRFIMLSMIGAWLLFALYAAFQGGFRLRNDATLFLPEVTTDGSFREGFAYIGDAAFFSGQYDQALPWYEAALADKPGVIAYVDRASVANNAAGALLALNRPHEADRLLKQVPLNDNSSLSLSIRYNRALIAHTLGRYEETVLLLDGAYPWMRTEPVLLLQEARRKISGK